LKEVKSSFCVAVKTSMGILTSPNDKLPFHIARAAIAVRFLLTALTGFAIYIKNISNEK
jgi:TRAP-type mannitol/chloroaromatic compound transport system permease small subunit